MEIKPCPRCQSDHTGVVEVRFIGEARIECHNCKLAGPYKKSPQEAIDWWNTRAADPLLKEMAEALQGMADIYYGRDNQPIAGAFAKRMDDVLRKYHEQEAANAK